MISEINVYFRISEIVILDIQNNFFWISQIKRLFGINSDIWNKYFGYLKSEIFISDIQNKYSRYQKLCQKGVLFVISKKSYFGYPKYQFLISEINVYFRIHVSVIVILDIQNNFLTISDTCIRK